METIFALMIFGFYIIMALMLGWLLIYAVIFAIGIISYGAYWVYCKIVGKEME